MSQIPSWSLGGLWSGSRGRSSKLSSLLLAFRVSLLAAVVCPTLASAASDPADKSPIPAPEPRPTASSSPLRVSVDPAIADAAFWPQWLDERNPTVAHDISTPGHEQWINVQIDGATYDYRVTVTAIRDGEPVRLDNSPHTCECNTESLLSLLDREIAKAVEQLGSAQVEAGKPRASEPELEPSSASEPEPTPADAKAPRRWQVSALGVGGAATGAFGLLAVGAGVSLVVAKNREIPDRSKYYRELDPLGYTAMAVGVAAVAGGITLLVIDVSRQARDGRHASRRPAMVTRKLPSEPRRRLTVYPHLTPRSMGLACLRRF